MKPIDESFTNEVPASSASLEPALIDPQQLATFIDLGPAAYRDVLGDALRQIPAHLTTIRDAIQDGNIPQLNATAHQARGTLLTFGCVAMTHRCVELEAWKTLIPGQAASIHAELKTLWEQTIAAINQWEQSVPEFAV